MKKKILIIIWVIIVLGAIAFLIRTKCSFPKEKVPQPVNEMEAITGIIKEWTKDTETLQTITTNFWTCISNLQDAEVIKIDEVIRNCNVKQKTSQVNGVGGVFPQLFIYNGTFVEREEVANSPDENIVCRDYQEDDSVRYYLKMKDDPSSWNRWYNRDDENFHKGFLEAIQKVVWNSFLNQISTNFSDNIYCNEDDEDCWFMTAGYGRSDWENYFVAGYRNSHWDFEEPLYFVINDKLYEAGGRQFAGIKNDKIIIKKVDNIQQFKEPLEPRQTTFTLETCEIDL